MTIQELVNFYHSLCVYTAIAALVFLAVAILLFFKLKIPQVFGELTGRTAQKAIDEMTAEGTATGSLASMKVGTDGRRQRKSKSSGQGTGGLKKNTSKASGRLAKERVSGGLAAVQAEKQEQKPGQGQANAGKPTFQFDPNFGGAGSEETDVLDTFGSEETNVLSNDGTLASSAEQPKEAVKTAEEIPVSSQPKMPIYIAPESETMVLSQELKPDHNVFIIERSIVEIHTDEVI